MMTETIQTPSGYVFQLKIVTRSLRKEIDRTIAKHLAGAKSGEVNEETYTSYQTVVDFVLSELVVSLKKPTGEEVTETDNIVRIADKELSEQEVQPVFDRIEEILKKK